MGGHVTVASPPVHTSFFGRLNLEDKDFILQRNGSPQADPK